MQLIMNGTALLATFGVVAGIGSFGIAIAKIKGKGQVNGNGLNGKLSTGKVLELVGGKIKEFWEGPCKSERDNREKMMKINHEAYKEELKSDRDNQEKILVVNQKMYKVELKAASDVLKGEVASIKGEVGNIKELLEDGLKRIDDKIDGLNGIGHGKDGKGV